jgi:serine/threonine protein kinase
MALSAGTRLGPYEILSPTGAGGMGEVYKARDTRLDRIVAIKLSKIEFSERFEREARAVAALNHPNICQLYDVGPNYLVMENIEGTPLKGPLPLDQALKYATQICDALDAAHKKNITHRDLKPANILVTKAGVKLLDFGLAKVTPTVKAGESTATMAITVRGEILGTLLYMSPEQINGQDAGPRSDIFSFGLVLYEILTGKRALEGSTPASVIAAILERPAPSVSDVAPPALDRLLMRCLEKDPDSRWQSARDLKAALELVTAGTETSVDNAAEAKALSRHWMPWATAAGVTIALATLAFAHFREKSPVKQMVRFEIAAPPNVTSEDIPSVSPDGRTIAFVGSAGDHKRMIWVRSLDALEARPLGGTEGIVNAPFWSSDSRFLAFGSGGKLKKIEATGGPVQELCDAQLLLSGAWTSDNKILFGALGPVQVVSAAGGTPAPLTALDRSRQELIHTPSAVLPDGHHFLYSRFGSSDNGGGVYIGSLDNKPEQQSSKVLLPDSTPVAYVPSPLTGDEPGLLLFVRGVTQSSVTGTLMAQRFDPKRMEVSGDATPIAEQVVSFSASSTGVLAFRTGGIEAETSQLTWYDRKGNVLARPGDPGEYSSLALSPSDGRLAYRRGNDLWLFEFARSGTYTKFTFGNFASSPVWSADGSRITFVSTRGGGFGVYQKASNLAGPEETLYESTDYKDGLSWTRDGRFVLYGALISDGKPGHLWILPADGSAGHRKPVSFKHAESEEVEGRFAPDGRWVAYRSSEAGKNEIYVRPFDSSDPSSSAAGGPRQVSKDGGDDPHWRSDGKELFYLAPDGYLMSVDVSSVGDVFQSGTPQRLFQSPTMRYRSWDVTTDGRRFLIAVPKPVGAEGTVSRPFQVVVNWTEMLKR